MHTITWFRMGGGPISSVNVLLSLVRATSSRKDGLRAGRCCGGCGMREKLRRWGNTNERVVRRRKHVRSDGTEWHGNVAQSIEDGEHAFKSKISL